MRSEPWLAALLVLASCGDEPNPPAGAPAESPAPGASNRAPEVSAEIVPATAIPGDELRVTSSVRDPEGDPVRVRVEWFVNRQRQDATADSLSTDALARGDEIYAIVRASDGSIEGVGQTPRVLLGNSAPRVTALTLRPEHPDASQTIVVEPTVTDRDADPYEVHYEWLVNGTPLANATGATLEPGRVKRGDTLRVRARASDADPGEPFESKPIMVANARPLIVSQPTMELAADDRYEYQIAARDPDGDRPLRYSLVSGPDGMEVDLVSGLVQWTLPSDAEGRFEIEVAVRDPQGAEARQSYALEFRLEKIPAQKSAPARSEERNDY